MADVFISYARKERDEAEAIKARLESLGLSVFLDVEGLDGGHVFSEVLDQQVKTAGVVLGLWSPLALTRPWVQTECDIGRERGVLVPVAIKAFDRISVPAQFWNIQFIDLTGMSDAADDPAWRALIKSLARTLHRPELGLAAKSATMPAPDPLVPFGAPAMEATPESIQATDARKGKTANTIYGPRNYVSPRPDALPRADAAVFYVLVRAALSRETITTSFLLAETRRLARKNELTPRWLDVSFNRILRAMLSVAGERGEVIPFIAAIAVEDETQVPPASIDGAARAWMEHSYSPTEAAKRQAELSSDRVRAVARMQNPVWAYPDWVALLPYVGVSPGNAEAYLAGDAGPGAMQSRARPSTEPELKPAGIKRGPSRTMIAAAVIAVLALAAVGLWFGNPVH